MTDYRRLLSREYVSAHATRMHEIPRFGYANDFSTLATNDPNSYITGLTIFFGIVSGLLVLWGLFILIFKCLGRSRVGFLSGNAMRWPGSAELERLEKEVAAYAAETDEDILTAEEVFENLVQDVERKVIVIRIMSLLCGTVVIAASILLVLFGLISAQKAYADFTSHSTDILEILQDGSHAMKSFDDVSAESYIQIEEIRAKLGSWCPASTNQKIDGISYGTASDALNEAINDVLGENDTFDTMALFDYEVANAVATFRNMKNAASESMWVYPVQVALAALLAVIALHFNMSVVLAWSEKFLYKIKRIEKVVFMPLFCLLIIICIVLMFSSASITTMAGDFCVDSQDSILSLTQGKFPLFSDILFTYFEGCRSPFFLESLAGSTENLASALTDFSARFQSTSSSMLSNECGADVTSFFNILKNLNSNTGVMYDSIDGTGKIFSCSNVHVSYSGIQNG
mmetsp:Transcript_10971/g.24173  ORF Transcript_10971/g.24173 Transcript_10971/m.24173 type:complete len:458 (-) Transcript_10971:2696-4069(-)